MRELLRLLLAACFYYSGLVKLAHRWTRYAGKRLIILNYHRASSENLRHQLLYLRRHYRLMHLDEALEELYAPCSEQSSHERRMPLVLTFDDGYLDNYSYGWRLARELQIPMTIFLIPGYSESGKCFWWLAADYLVQHANVEKVTIDGVTYYLARSEDRRILLTTIDNHMRYATSVAEREAFLSAMALALAVTLPCRATQGESDASLPLNWAEIREMAQSGWISFAAHTMHHPLLRYLAHASEMYLEVAACRRVLEQRVGSRVRSFAYPIGKEEHIGSEEVRAVKMAGYDWAVTTIEDVNTPQTDPHLLRRLPGDESQHWLVMASELVGLLGVLSRYRKKR